MLKVFSRYIVCGLLVRKVIGMFWFIEGDGIIRFLYGVVLVVGFVVIVILFNLNDSVVI